MNTFNGISFFIKTYSVELVVANYAIRSARNFCQGPAEIVLWVDTKRDLEATRSLGLDVLVDRIICSEELGVDTLSNGYVQQQCVKIIAYQYCKYELIFHVDSDMVFWRDFGPIDFIQDGLPILPFGEWIRGGFPSNHQVRRIQKLSGSDFRYVGQMEDALGRQEIRDAAGIKEFYRDARGSAVVDHTERKSVWTCNYPDILWMVSSRIFSAAPHDTMRMHYAVTSSILRDIVELISTRYGSVWRLSESLDDLPVFSEFQLIGNYMLSEYYSGSNKRCHPVPYMFMEPPYALSEKIPAIKYNRKNHPLSAYDDILAGRYCSIMSRRELCRVLGLGWV